jgi:hypothetical protein
VQAVIGIWFDGLAWLMQITARLLSDWHWHKDRGRWRDGADDLFVDAVAFGGAKAVTEISFRQSNAKKLVRKVVAPAIASASPGAFLAFALAPAMPSASKVRAKRAKPCAGK